MDEEILEEELIMSCDECERTVDSDEDLLPYEDIHVCIPCYDRLNLQDEQEIYKWETEGYDED